MYTELNIAVQLNNQKLDEDKFVLPILSYMVDGAVKGDLTVAESDMPDHPLFKTRRWSYMLQCDSFYFPHTVYTSLVHRGEDDIILNIRCDLKDYDDEIKKFLDWIYPYTETRGFIGYTRYEEDDDPTLVYFDDDGVRFKYV